MSRQKNLKRNLLICLLAGSAVMYTLPLHAATSVVANNALPENGHFVNDKLGTILKNPNNSLEMNITQSVNNAVITWDKFDVGGSATVNFKGPESGYNTLNYVNAGGSMSQIYGTINANNSGNIFIVNPAGVQIGNSAQINVGSLYVSNKTFSDDLLKTVNDTTVMNKFMKNGTANADAALMSLGNINANKVTFEGNGRIVIDSERIKNENTNLTADEIFINTNDKNNVVIGYEAYENGSYAGVDKNEELATLNGNGKLTKADGYMWVEDVEQLQAIGKNANTLSGNYALRNSIDATSTANWNEVNGTYAGFNPIGLDETTGKVIVNNNNEYGFTGNFDGLDYNIFGLTINRESEANVGLFGVAHNANINNVTLVGGSITGGSVVGSVIGAALGNTHITNATNSASVTGNTDVGGIVGYSGDKLDNDGLEIKVEEGKSRFTNLINTGSVYSKGEQGTKASNAGGLIGYMYNGTLDGNSYNLGDVSGDGYNVGGLVGHAVNSTIGDGTNLVYNRMDVTGAYNVGGIVGNMEGSTVKYAENSGTVMATGHTTEDYIYHTAITLQDNIPNGGRLDDAKDIAKVIVDVANVGGIAGTSAAKDGKASEITNVTNTGDVSSSKVAEQNYYAAGNVGGVVGRAEDTDITNATNKENDVRGAHNVGGIAGYFGSSKGDETGENVPRYTVTNGINDGGDIMATGARGNGNFVQELVRRVADGSNEKFTVGNIGGVVGYMDGDNVYVTGSANRGTVHTSEPAEPADVKDWEKAANVGGIVGKIDRSDTKELDKIKKNTSLAAVNNSYNTGDVLGYTGVGGVVGMMYNGEVAGSYNLGYIGTTRQTPIDDTNIDSLNMGGVVGDTTENANAKGVVIYDVYNKGQIGDSEFNYYGRHVGGIVGRLSGTVEKAYNTGAIYNGYSVVGGIAGWVAAGSINNAFNTGNITVYNQNKGIESQVGGIAGAVKGQKDTTTTISNAYNLGTIRSFKAKTNNSDKGINLVGGIVGDIRNSGEVIIKNVYTTGNIYAGIENASGNITEDTGNNIGSIYGRKNGNTTKTNAYYIKPAKDENGQQLFTELTGNRDNSNQAINFDDKDNLDKYKYIDENDGQEYSLSFSTQDEGSGDVVHNTNDNWRIYYGNTPILNAFLPDSEKYFAKNGLTDNSNNTDKTFNGSIQYGTAYDPLLTIINTDRDLVFNFGTKDNELSITNAAGLAVYGGGVTLNNFTTSSGSGYFGGTIYADGALNINGVKNDIGIGSAADIYGSAVNIITDGKVTIYGDVTATGNTDNGTTEGIDSSLTVENAGDINIAGSDVDVYGKLTSASDTHGSSVTIPGIEGSAVTWEPGEISNPDVAMSDIADRFAHTTGASAVDGNITITANGTPTDVDGDGTIETDEVIGGNVNLYYGNKGEGLITTGGDLTVTGAGDVYVDSDLNIGGNLTLAGTGAESEVVLDITNIGQVQDKNDNSPDIDNSTEYLHDFLDHFTNTTDNSISFGNTQDAKITVDMWENNKLNLDKFATNFTGKLNTLHITNANGKNAQQLTHIWVSNGDQLKGIQEAAKGNSDILGYNFALKGDINASHVKDYEAIGTGSANGFTGTFNGRGNRIIGLNVSATDSANNNTNAGIFSTVGTDGVVKDVNIYSGTFTGTTTAGAVAGVNNGRIEGIVTFGNTVTVTGNNGNAGGIVGVNNNGGTVDDVESSGSVIAEGDNVIVGGLVGTNESGATVNNSYSNSAVTSTSGTDADLGGVVGVNEGTVSLVDSLGVTNGTNSTNVGGVIGINSGTLNSAYNESIVNGNSNVGGIIGKNDGGSNYIEKEDGTVTWSKGTVENVVNATGVTGTGDYVGGLVGTNIGSVENGRNNGTITGTKYVGGLVGDNASEKSVLTNLVNDSSASIIGVKYVGGIAGSNAGTITTGNEETDETVNLINRGTITGQQYVGGVAGSNSGTITNANNDVELNVKDSTATGNDAAEYFGGIAGENTGTINNATNTADVNADGATYVGGIVGKNDGTLKDMAGNSGNVTGKNYVGGVAGLNTNNKPLDSVKASNTGTVFATAGGAGGIFAVNNANITNSKLTNNGAVIGKGGNGTGGIFGVNSGDISESSLINEVDGQVIGTNNVGGLIGKNTGTITGGRDDADSYYKYQIYNNGVINVGTYGDTNNDGDYEFTAGTGSNIGGLIGNNAVDDSDPNNVKTGSLTAGYNTGAINASGSKNVGGIAGSNSGKIDQVFNTVMTPDNAVKPDGSKQEASITGGTNVGGLVGDNSGTLSNAYNTTREVKGDAVSTGNLVGTNSGTVQYVYGYGVDSIDELIGEVTGTGSISNGHAIGAAENSWFQQDVYEDFTFGANGWKIYDGSTLPMLSVFLTKVTVVDQHLVDQYFSAKHYGEFHQITADDIKALIAIGAISAPDGFGAFNNNNGLIQGVADDAMANSGNWLYSQQILGSNINGLFNPNNLGYDISLVYSPFELDNDPSSHWNYLFNDAPFDRNKDFRERKAEVNFVDGGMEI